MTQEKVTEILEVIDNVLKEYKLTLVLPEDMKEYQETKEDCNEASIYGDIYYALEDALRKMENNTEKKKGVYNGIFLRNKRC